MIDVAEPVIAASKLHNMIRQPTLASFASRDKPVVPAVQRTRVKDCPLWVEFPDEENESRVRKKTQRADMGDKFDLTITSAIIYDYMHVCGRLLL